MKEKEKLGFFKRVYLAMTDFRIYPFVQREKVSAAVWHFILLILILSIILAIAFSNKIFEGIATLVENYDEAVPKFTLSNGVLAVEEKVYEEYDEVKVVIDTSLTIEEFSKSDEGKEVLYSTDYAVINNDGIIYTENGASIIYNFDSFEEPFTSENLYQLLAMTNDDWSIKLAIFSTMILIIFLAYLLVKVLNSLVLILATHILNFAFGLKLKFGNYVRIVLYALTLPLIVEVISILYLGKISEYVTVAYQLLAYVYIFYALRAIKLDVLLMGAAGTTIKEKMQDIIEKLENEVEDKMKNESKKATEEEQKEEESESNDEK